MLFLAAAAATETHPDPLIADSLEGVSGDALKTWLLIAMFFLLFADRVINMVRNKGVPQPLEVRPAREFASASGVKTLADRVTKLDTDLQGFKTEVTNWLNDVKTALSGEGESRAIRINERIDDLFLVIGELRGSDKAHGSQLETIIQAIVSRRNARTASIT